MNKKQDTGVRVQNEVRGSNEAKRGQIYIALRRKSFCQSKLEPSARLKAGCGLKELVEKRLNCRHRWPGVLPAEENRVGVAYRAD
jgi:hypothetical protein